MTPYALILPYHRGGFAFIVSFYDDRGERTGDHDFAHTLWGARRLARRGLKRRASRFTSETVTL